jgi:hypothetical protein
MQTDGFGILCIGVLAELPQRSKPVSRRCGSSWVTAAGRLSGDFSKPEFAACYARSVELQRSRAKVGHVLLKSRSSRGACATLLVAMALGATGTLTASATVGAKRSIKKVNLTVTVEPSVTLKGTKGQCLITPDGYNIDFDGKDYPTLGAGGGLSSGGPGPATDPTQLRSYTAFNADIAGVSYGEDDSSGLDAISSAVSLNVKKKIIKFNAYPIIAFETGARATMTGTVKCR